MKEIKQSCTNCNHTTKLSECYPRCPICNEPLTISLINSGSINYNASLVDPFWVRYRDFYPYLDNSINISLGEGNTPLVALDRVSSNLELRSVFVKNETINPTWSFKDRGSVIGIINAIQNGFDKIGTVSTGNMAASMAAYGARANLQTYIFVKGDMLQEKVNPIAIYGPKVLQVKGDYSVLYEQSLQIGQRKEIAFINSDVPMRVEGSKSIAYEICEQTNFDVPDYVIIPTSAGGNFRGIVKGFAEFYEAGIIDKMPKPVCAQSLGCAPITKAYLSGSNTIEHFGATDTIAPAIGNPNPPSGNEVLRLLEKYMGIAVSVTNDEIIKAQKELAENGIFSQPAGAVPLAALYKLVGDKIPHDSSVALIATGGGLKDTSALNYHSLEAETINITELVDKL
jgi:threonine synthase